VANYYTHYSFVVLHPDPAACRERLLNDRTFLEAIAVAVVNDAEDWELYSDVAEAILKINEEVTGFWITDDASHSTEVAIAAGQAILTDQKSTDTVTFQASFGCDKPRLDAYGGMACVFNRDHFITRATADEDFMDGLLAELADAI
jgi:hypothetical protein